MSLGHCGGLGDKFAQGDELMMKTTVLVVVMVSLLLLVLIIVIMCITGAAISCDNCDVSFFQPQTSSAATACCVSNESMVALCDVDGNLHLFQPQGFENYEMAGMA